jgi:hypothetical protein
LLHDSGDQRRAVCDNGKREPPTVRNRI